MASADIGAHIAQLLEFGGGFLPGLLGEFRLGDLLFQLGQLVTAVIPLSQLLLDSLELFVEIVLALGLLHLALDAAANLLFHLHHADFAFHQRVNPLQPFAHALDL